jgi:hypothetical protein
MGYRAGDAYTILFPTTIAGGAAGNADSLPVATANKNGTDDGTFTLTVANLDAGRYKATGTIPAGYVGGDVLNVTVAATIGGTATKARVDAQVIDRPPSLQKNKALAALQFYLALAADGQSAATGKTVTATRSIDGGAYGACTNAVSELTGGEYTIAPSAADMNGSVIAFAFAAAACITTRVTLVTQL